MSVTLNVVDPRGQQLASEEFGSPDGVLERVEALKRQWPKARFVQVCANGALLFTIDIKRT